jgi:Arc/MetJ-type ribon-helix-helix transcriptional regulator
MKLLDRHNRVDTQVKLITLYLPEPYIRALDSLVDENFYPNRAEAIRVAIKDMLSIEVWGRKGNVWRKKS